MSSHGANLADGRPRFGPGSRRPGRPASVEVHHSLQELREEWDELAERTGAAPFLRPGWIEPFLRTWGSGAPLALTVRRDGRLAGLLPLQARAGAISSPTNWQTPLFGPLAEDAGVASELIGGLLAQARRRADLWFVHPEAPGYAESTEAARRAGFRLIARTIAQSPYVAVEGSFDEYMASLSRKFRKDIG
ncbi:MAG: hypothetical protein QOD53_1654, partial [Thermoleophilaceae bacterium]|nr:hypothetical protein [Thermoleophilaceae bacterium]